MSSRVVGRLLAALCALVAGLAGICPASAECDALILIQPGIAGPSVSWDDYVFPTWVYWSPEIYPQSHSALLSIVTGQNWVGDPKDSLFHANKGGAIVSQNAESLDIRGVLRARSAFLNGLQLHALAGRERSLHETTLLLCTEARNLPIDVVGMSDRIPDSGLVVHEASSWDDVSNVARKVHHALVIEYPPIKGRPWTRFWLRGRGFPSGVPQNKEAGFPGLVPASQILKLLTQPTAFAWVQDDSRTWGGVHKWLTKDIIWAPLWRTFAGSVVAGTLIIAMLFVLKERRAKFLSILLLVLLLSPSASVLGGEIAGFLGIEWFPLSFWICLVLLLATTSLGQWVCGQHRWKANKWLAPSVLSLLSLSLTNPKWSPLGMSANFATDPAPMAFGCWFAALVSSCAHASGTVYRWPLRIAVAAMCIFPLIRFAWWAPQPMPYAGMPLAAFLLVEGKSTFAPAIPILAGLTSPGILHGIAWKPYGLMQRESDLLMLPASEYVNFFTSPFFMLTAATVFVFCLICDRFLIHQYRVLASIDSRKCMVLRASGWLALSGLLQPALLPAALWCAIGGVAILLHDALIEL